MSKFRIVVEGMDSTGKSTLIDSLRQEFHSLVVVVNTLGPDQDFDRWWPEELGRDYGEGFCPIHDRFYYSELIYGSILRGYVKASGFSQLSTKRALREHALLIYARPSTESIIGTIDNKPQMEGVIERRERLLGRYDNVMAGEQSHYGDRFVKYDYEASDALDIVKTKVERYLGFEI